MDLLFASDSPRDVDNGIAPNVRRGASFAQAFHSQQQENETEDSSSSRDPAELLKQVAGHAKVLLLERATHVAEVKMLREAVAKLRQTAQHDKNVIEGLQAESTTLKTDLVASKAKLATVEAQLKSSKETAKGLRDG